MLRFLQKVIAAEWPVRLLSPVLGRFNPFLPAFRLDPYPVYDELRRNSPAYKSRMLGSYILTRHDDCTAVLNDPRMSCLREESRMAKQFDLVGSMSEGLGKAVTRSLLMIDAPDHTRIRRLVAKAFTPRVVERLRSRADEVVSELLDEMERKAAPDLIRDLADPLPTIMIAELLGVPSEDHAQFKAWSNDSVLLLDPLQSQNGFEPIERAFAALSEYLGSVFEARRREPREDLISALVAVEEEGERLNEDELYSLCLLLLVAGNETTTNLIGNGTLALLRNPDQFNRLREDPGVTRSAVEELLRFDSPIQLSDRMASEDMEVLGKRVRKGDLVGLSLGAANRDPAHFAAPHQLDLAREDNDHLAFGHGVHFCLGAQLARLEAQVAFRALADRYPNLAWERGPLDYKRSMVVRGLTALPLALNASARAA